MKFPNVLVVTPDVRPAGTQRVQLQLAKGLVVIGCETTLVVAVGRSEKGLRVSEGVSLEWLGDGESSGKVAALRSLVEASRADCIVTALNPINWLGWRALRSLPPSERPRHIMTLHNHFEAKWRGQFTPTAPLRRLIFRFLFGRADSVVTVSEGLRQLVLSLGVAPEKVHTVRNSVEVEHLRTLAAEPLDDPWLAEVGKVPVILGVGRLEPQKDFETLLRAFALARRDRPLRLVILGEGSERRKLERLIDELELEDCVRVPGFSPNPYAWMRRASLFVLSSRWEGFPLVLLEAIAVGCPIISTDCPTGPAEILGSNDAQLVPCGDPEAMGIALLRMLDSPVMPDRKILRSAEEMARDYLRVAGWRV